MYVSGAGRQLFVLIVAYLCTAAALPSPTVPGIGGFLAVTQGDSCQLAQLTLSPCVAALVISFNLSVHAYIMQECSMHYAVTRSIATKE